MKKIIALSMVAAMVIAVAGCNNNAAATTTTTAAAETTPAETTAAAETEAAETEAEVTEAETEAEATDAETDEAPAAVMSYAEYAAADIDAPVVIEAYVQAMQSWWDNKATIYAQDEDGAYFLYNAACAEDVYNSIEQGTKIRVSGYKAEWSGEIEIADATFEIIDGNFVAEAKDVTDILANTDELIKFQNQFVSFKGMTVEAKQDAEGNDVAFLYNWDGSGEDGNDLYFNVSKDGTTYTFTVESYLCDNTTEVYSAVKNLKIGDVIDMEGFLYWYEGANPHITSVKAAE